MYNENGTYVSERKVDTEQGARYVATFTPQSINSSSSSDGLKTITVDAETVHDLVGNANQDEVVFEWNYHGTSPTITIISSDDDVNDGNVSNSELVFVQFHVDSGEMSTDFSVCGLSLSLSVYRQHS
jgi:hypothetical protein